METVIYLDTHAAMWLRGGQVEKFSSAARKAIEESDLLISPMVFLEFQYLFEIGRFTESGQAVFDALSQRAGVSICDLPFSEVAKEAMNHNWTRDPFDRLIVSQARVGRASLVSKDSVIKEHYAKVIW